MADVVKLTIYVVDAINPPIIRAVRDEFIGTEDPPISTLVCVAGLILPELLIEIEACAAVRGSREPARTPS